MAEMQQQLREGVDTCSRVLALQQPLPSEPVIFVSTGHLKTIDPCCLVRAPLGRDLGSAATQEAQRDECTACHTTAIRGMNTFHDLSNCWNHVLSIPFVQHLPAELL